MNASGAAKMNGGDALVATLLSHGVRAGFAVPGESYLAVLEALRREQDNFRLITCRHEAGASFAAEAYGKLTRNPGAAFVTRGPGATNASIGVHTAAQDSSPMVLFIGQIPSSHKGREAFQEIDYQAMFGTIAKAVIEPHGPADVARATAEALDSARAGRPGPVVVPLPEDVTENDAGDPAIPGPVAQSLPAPDPDAVVRAVELISAAKHPIVVSGEMVTYHDAQDSLARFAEAAGAGVFTSFRRQDSYDNFGPAYIGHLGLGRAPFQRKVWDECDLVVVAGNRLDAITSEDYKLLRHDQTLIHIHADPTVLGHWRQPKVAIAADTGAALDAIAAALPPPANERSEWCATAHAEFLRFRENGVAALGKVDVAEVVKTVGDRLTGDHIITNDAGNFSSWLHRHFPYRLRNSQAGPMAGAMGAAVPSAMAAQLARPKAQVVAFVGDGGFMMTGQEMLTAAQHDLPIKVIVGDNGAYGTILMHQHQAHGAGNYHGVH
ncbi:MAG: thiamine pyrophosphate-binding protein, partial [Pseudomonadota bacterium]|nr:thiamine pyrophosphate-binding protein [Pseudomonadota bacterium]